MAAISNPKDQPWKIKWGSWGRLWHLKHGPYTACIQWWQGTTDLSWRIVKDGESYSYKDFSMHPYRMTMGQGEAPTAAMCMDKCIMLLNEFLKDEVYD